MFGSIRTFGGGDLIEKGLNEFFLLQKGAYWRGEALLKGELKREITVIQKVLEKIYLNG